MSALLAGDTIVAPATPVGHGGVAVVRLSGPRARSIVERMLRRVPAPFEARRVHVVRVCEPESRRFVDEAVVFWMEAPRTYTGEQTAEVQLHGGPQVVAQVVEMALGLGARLASPGEFTRRAFLNGRLDLLQAEAVAGLIAARSGRAARLAQDHLEGRLRSVLETRRQQLVELRAEVEAHLDFPDEELEIPSSSWAERAGRLAGELAAWADGYGRTRWYVEGATVVLAGVPNAGKSALFNALLGAERALVAPEAGTTRDYVEGRLELAGIPVTLVDTAGLRGEASELELRGMAMGRRQLERADLVLAVVDGTAGLEAQDETLRLLDGRLWLGAINKCDLPGSGSVGGLTTEVGWVRVSALTGQGLEELRSRLVTVLAGEAAGEESVLVASARQAAALRAASEGLRRAGQMALRGGPPELVAADLQEASTALGELVGEITSDELLDALFARFCLGK